MWMKEERELREKLRTVIAARIEKGNLYQYGKVNFAFNKAIKQITDEVTLENNKLRISAAKETKRLSKKAREADRFKNFIARKSIKEDKLKAKIKEEQQKLSTLTERKRKIREEYGESDIVVEIIPSKYPDSCGVSDLAKYAGNFLDYECHVDLTAVFEAADILNDQIITNQGKNIKHVFL